MRFCFPIINLILLIHPKTAHRFSHKSHQVILRQGLNQRSTRPVRRNSRPRCGFVDGYDCRLRILQRKRPCMGCVPQYA
uniref:Secreted protein n=1 Tax=Rhizophora mucronata TaxID=61149 RepID=A0A2P2NIS4_RHIMU